MPPPSDHLMTRTQMALTELPELQRQHRELDARIAVIGAEGPSACTLEVQRLKRQKLMLKDRIARLQDVITPDIIA